MSLGSLLAPNIYNLYSGNFHVLNDLIVDGSLDINNITVDTFNVTGTDDSTNTLTGALTVVGGIGIGKSTSIGGNLAIFSNAKGSIGTAGGALISGDVSINSPTPAVSTSTGALTVKGGTSVGGDLYVGGTIYGSQVPFPLSVPHLAITDTTDSGGTDNGVLTVAGGVGFGKSLYVGSYICCDSFQDYTGGMNIRNYAGFKHLTLTNEGNTGNIILNSKTGNIQHQINTVTVQTITDSLITNAVAEKITVSTASSDTASGALVVAGGVGIAGDLRVGGTIYGSQVPFPLSVPYLAITNTTVSAGTSSGALTVVGGVGIGGAVNVGGAVQTPSLSLTDNATVSPIVLYLSGGQNLGTIGASFLMLSSGYLAFIIMNEFTTSGMLTNASLMQTAVDVIPLNFRPVNDFYSPFTVIQNGVYVTGTIRICSTGQIIIYGTYVASQSNGYARVSLLYSLL